MRWTKREQNPRLGPHSGSILLALTLLAAFRPDAAQGQSAPMRLDGGAQVIFLSSSTFDAADVGLGGRIAWHPIELLGVEAELNLYPRSFPGPRAFSRHRAEGLFGLTAGVPFGRLRPFLRVRPGFVTVREAPEPFPCILIFPPPLACALASGRTLFALDIGGGVEVPTSSATFVRLDLGDRLLRYPGPVFDARTRRDGPFMGHDFRMAAGAGLRF